MRNTIVDYYRENRRYIDNTVFESPDEDEQDKEYSLQAVIKSQEVYNRNAEITRQNAEIEAQNAQAKAERRAKCTCCHGTGQVTKLGMYMGQESITTVSVNGLQQKSTTSVPVYGSSTIVECSCCK